MEITLYNFTKRKNSTLIPTGGINVNVNLKNETSVYTPIFLLSVNDVENYNYLQWSNRYYYITDIVKSNIKGVWELSCSLDVLATYKSDILNTSAFTLYSSSDYDVYIPDSRLSVDEEPIVNTSSVNLADFKPISGTYILTYVSKSQTQYAPVGISYLSRENMLNVGSQLMSEGFSNLLEEVPKQLADAKSAIINCKYVPLTLPSIATYNLELGSYDTRISCGIPTKVINYSKSLTIPWNFNDFRNMKPYTDLIIYLPGYGFAQLDPADYIGQSSITVRCIIDGITGDAVYMVGNKSRFETSFAQEIAVGSNKTDLMHTIASGVGGAGALLGGIATDNAKVAIAGAGALYNAFVHSVSHNLGSVGSNGGLSGIIANISAEQGGDIYLMCISHDTSVSPSSVASTIGRPLNRVKQMGALSGYVETTNFSVNTNAPDLIKDQINNYMNGGVYIE